MSIFSGLRSNNSIHRRHVSSVDYPNLWCGACQARHPLFVCIVREMPSPWFPAAANRSTAYRGTVDISQDSRMLIVDTPKLPGDGYIGWLLLICVFFNLLPFSPQKQMILMIGKFVLHDKKGLFLLRSVTDLTSRHFYLS